MTGKNLVRSILVVDDVAQNRELLRDRLEAKGYRVEEARDGREALNRLAAGGLDLVLLDVMMAGMNGLAALEAVRATHSRVALPVIMTTALDRSADVVQALRLGANDYVTKPIDFPVLLARVETQLSLKESVERVLELERNLTERNRELEAANDSIRSASESLRQANERMRSELEAAAELQKTLLPGTMPELEGLRFAWSFKPCDELAGDIFNLFRLDEKHLGIYLLDVSGHGVKAALLSVTLSHLLSPQASPSGLLVQYILGPPGYRIVGPAEVAASLNRRFPMQSDTQQFFTILYGLLDLADMELRYVAAGHTGLAHLSSGRAPELLDSTGAAIGVDEEGQFEERSLRLRPGDRLVLCSDGIAEAMSPSEDLFGDSRLLAELDRGRGLDLRQSLDALMRILVAWAGPRGLRDDVSLLGIEVTGAALDDPSHKVTPR